jgi:crossover junction endonuclease EME1
MTLDTAFCMESGQVKTGADPADTFIKMLQEVNRITAPIAYGIAAEYPTAQKLVKGFEKEGKDMLQELKKSANKDGALTDREIGKKISRRLWGIFMNTDPESTDI